MNAKMQKSQNHQSVMTASMRRSRQQVKVEHLCEVIADRFCFL